MVSLFYFPPLLFSCSSSRSDEGENNNRSVGLQKVISSGGSAGRMTAWSGVELTW